MQILIVDDHPVVRKGVVALLRSGIDGATTLEASTVEEALAIVAGQTTIDALVLDLFLPDDGGQTAIRRIREIRGDLPLLVLSASEDPRDMRRALSQGALGYVAKSASPQVFLSALRLVANGDLYVPPQLVEDALPEPLRSAAGGADARLTERQVEILRLLADGIPNKLIAHRLQLSEKTVKAHITSIFRSLGVINRTQAANAGREAGLI